jgi:hypothetical protein
VCDDFDGLAGQDRGVAIDYFGLLSDEGWLPLPVDPADPRHFWGDGHPIADAPVDLAATCRDSISYSTKVDPAFNLRGLRCRPGFTIPMRHVNHDQLTIVFGGSVDVEFLDRGESADETGDVSVAAFDIRTIGVGEFFVVDAGTPFMMTAGPDGVTFIESWREPAATLETHWHDRGW